MSGKPMYNGKNSISASELNQYIFCPYQWYYERLYGRAYIRAQYKERNRALGLADSVQANFNKGSRFHRGYLLRNRLRLLLKAAVFITLVMLFIYIYFLYRGY